MFFDYVATTIICGILTFFFQGQRINAEEREKMLEKLNTNRKEWIRDALKKKFTHGTYGAFLVGQWYTHERDKTRNKYINDANEDKLWTMLSRTFWESGVMTTGFLAVARYICRCYPDNEKLAYLEFCLSLAQVLCTVTSYYAMDWRVIYDYAPYGPGTIIYNNSYYIVANEIARKLGLQTHNCPIQSDMLKRSFIRLSFIKIKNLKLVSYFGGFTNSENMRPIFFGTKLIKKNFFTLELLKDYDFLSFNFYTLKKFGVIPQEDKSIKTLIPGPRKTFRECIDEAVKEGRAPDFRDALR